MIVVFTYGTLMRGGRYASQFNKDRKYVELAKLTGYKMWDSGNGYPVIKYTDDENDFVVGELHLYDNAKNVLKRMSEIKGYNAAHPESSLFVLKKCDYRIELAGKKNLNVYYFTYNKGVHGLRPILNGQWLNKK